MTNRTAVGILMLFAPSTPLVAQAAAKPLAFPARSAVAAGSARDASHTAICDGSEIRSARHRAVAGVAIMATSLPVALVGMYRTAHSSDHPQGPVAIGVSAGAALAIAGFVVAASGRPDESFWQDAIDRMTPGETSSDDVRSCLERPIAMATTDSSEEWTYLTSRGGLSGRGRLKTVRLTFRDSVLVGIRRAEIDASVVGDLAHPLVRVPFWVPDPH